MPTPHGEHRKAAERVHKHEFSVCPPLPSPPFAPAGHCPARRPQEASFIMKLLGLVSKQRDTLHLTLLPSCPPPLHLQAIAPPVALKRRPSL